MISPETVLEINLRDLRRRYLDGDPLAAQAAALLDSPPRGAAEINVEWLLRHHGQQEVNTRRELDLREGMDRLLAFYARVELACLCGYVPSPLPADLTRAATTHLSNWHVRTYYEKHYPLLLPKLLRLRLKSPRPSANLTPGSNARRLFLSFLELNDSIEDDDDISVFLWLLDDMSWGFTSLEDLNGVVADPKQFGKCLARESGDSILDRAANGLRKYFVFCVGLNQLLGQAGGIPVIASAFWHYHSYWFGRIDKKLDERFADFIRRLKQWPGMDDSALDTVEVALRALMDARQGAVLQARAEEPSNE
jgi:hypothetical protein